jgi:5-methylcytosine-specific restriction endonuclease McrA
MDKVCISCKESFYVSPSRGNIKNCSYECNKIWRKNESIKLREQMIDCACGCKAKIPLIGTATHRRKFVNGHQSYLRRIIRQPKTNHQIGKKHWNWKGGITSEDKRLRQLFRETMQQNIFARDNYSCQICDEGGYLQVDHIKTWADYPELRFTEGNCRTLCMACHYYVTFKKKLPKGIIWGHNLSRRIGS